VNHITNFMRMPHYRSDPVDCVVVMFLMSMVYMDIGTKVKLVSFNGSLESPDKCDPSDNYWILIGATGTISKIDNARGRLLVTFDSEVSDLGLHCHNEIPNSLLILVSDLEVI
jgi:hypothetical protein